MAATIFIVKKGVW